MWTNSANKPVMPLKTGYARGLYGQNQLLDEAEDDLALNVQVYATLFIGGQTL